MITREVVRESPIDALAHVVEFAEYVVHLPYKRSGDVVGALIDLDKLGDALERARASLVRQARSEGASWALIGDALGISKQAAQQKWGVKS